MAQSLALSNLRTDSGLSSAFEEFCCQIFRRAPEAAASGNVFKRIHGAGGDGGVEATWTFGDGRVWGLQAKSFSKLAASEKAQIAKSLDQAVANYAALQHYSICLPIKLTGPKGAKTGKQTKGSHDTLASWIKEWRTKYAAAGRNIEIDVWDEFELLSRLIAADTSGGLRRYWFGADVFSNTWFKQRLTEARALAGERYSPQLSVSTPLADAVEAFGCEPSCRERVRQLADRHEKARWRRGKLNLALLQKDKEASLERAAEIDELLGAAAQDPADLSQNALRDAATVSLQRARALEPKLRAELIATYGPQADTPGFRQYRAGYHVDFPMQPLDDLRAYVETLEAIEQFVSVPVSILPAERAMLISGEAGVGKTHGIVDASFQRDGRGLRSVVLFGEQVDQDPWTTLAIALGLGAAAGSDQLLDALDAAGEASGLPLIIFVDALNETQPDRTRWQTWLPPMIEKVKARKFLKLCVSCRDTYKRQVLPATPKLTEIIHNGFLGREYTAQLAFFRHYSLPAPPEPLFQIEFANPLFLRLVCESLAESAHPAIPVGSAGILAVLNLLVEAKNARAAKACDYDARENRVDAALKRLADAMAAGKCRLIPLADARAITDGVAVPVSKSLLSALEHESLVSVVERATPAGVLHFVRFTFERIGDHVIAGALLAQVSDPQTAFGENGPLQFTVDDQSMAANAGLLEALSVQLAEVHGQELVDLIGTESAGAWYAFLAGLQWRSGAHLGPRTAELVAVALSHADFRQAAFEAVLRSAARSDSPVNAKFLDGFLRRHDMLDRDPWWSTMLEKSYSDWSDVIIEASGVHRLIDAALRADLTALDSKSGALWLQVLAWFCASPDRRIRDQSTLAMATVLKSKPDATVGLIDAFAVLDEEYIVERVLLAAYGGLLLSRSADALQATADRLFSLYFDGREPPDNVSIRDHARLIIELAHAEGALSANVVLGDCRPPFSSPWPLHTPTEDDVQPLAKDEERYPLMNLAQPMGLALGTDFARYVVEPRAIEAFDVAAAGMDKVGVLRWFLSEVSKLGYPGRNDECAKFDHDVIQRFGAGRGKAGWPERLGKKYYWILLRRLIGRFADHLTRRGYFPDLRLDAVQGLDLRDLDPTDLRRYSQAEPEDTSWATAGYFTFPAPISAEDDAAWLALDNFPKLDAVLTVGRPALGDWCVLESHSMSRGQRPQRESASYPMVTCSIQTFLCALNDLGAAEAAFKAGALFGDSGVRDYRGFLGEFPRYLPYNHASSEDLFKTEKSGVTLERTVISQLRENEWEYDYGGGGKSPHLLMPCARFVEQGALIWDGAGRWLDAKGEELVVDPHWRGDERSSLFIRAEYLDSILSAKKAALLYVCYREKYVTSGANYGRLTEKSLFVRAGSKTKTIHRDISSD